MADSRQLFAEYVKSGSESAFRELVARYVDLVYSAAVRLVDGDTHLAEDVAQTVFADLARMAPTLSKDIMLGGWLHRHTVFVAAKTMRSERRRQSRERQAVEMNAWPDHSEANLKLVAPVLDEAINELGSEDRAAILLRFFEQHDFRSVGAAMGSTEEAARKRVARALEKLHTLLKHRGVTFSATGLGAAMITEAVTAAPVGLAASISTAALAGTAGTGTALTFLKFMAMTKLKAGIVGAIVVAGVMTPLVVQHQTQVRLREENQSLRQQVKQATQLAAENERLSKLLADAKNAPVLRLPAPPMAPTVVPVETATDDLRSTNLIAQLLKGGDAPKLTTEQIDSYLKENRRNAASLLAAYRATNDPKLLQEAMERFPDDPQVAFHAVFKKDASPEERRQWLEAFKRNAPDNALASYLSALDYFKTGQANQAVQELIAASGRAHFQDYSADSVQNDEEAWRTAGYSVAESKTLASMLLVLPHLIQLKQLSQEMVSLANSYRQTGDEASAQAALQMGFNLGQRLDGSPGQALISQLVGIAIQSIALRAMEPNSPFGSGGQTVKDQLDELTRQRAAIRELTSQFDSLQQRMSDQDWISYKDRWRAFGEMAALRWMIGKHGQQ